ncbi:MAG: tetratricopeptide repeat protein [Bacteroidales bacterium]|nr:tetratricopeptide repeat protein [Bacteroidales bacterium]
MKRVAFFLLGCLSAMTCAIAQINTDRVLSIGRNALYFEDYVLSIQYFNEVIAVKPYLPEPYLYRSIAKIYLDDYLGASQDATACLERNPFITTAHQVRGIARQNMREYDAAIEDFEAGLKDQPENRTFLRALAVTYALKKEFAKADSCFRHFIELCPNEPSAYMNRAQMKMELGDSVRALELLNKVIQLDKSSSYAFALRSMLLEQQDRHREALADMNMAIRLDPEQPSFYINRALIWYNIDELSNAVADYDQALELDPNSTVGHYNRGLLRAQVGDRNRAIDDFTAVIAQEPDNTFSIYNRAILRDEVGELEGAIEDYTLVYEQHPNYFPVLYARSEARRKLGQTKLADDDYKLAFAVQNRVKDEHEAREKARQAAIAAGDVVADETEMADKEDAELTDDERTRKESERNIRKFNRLMTSGVGDESQRYSSELRGRVQDKKGNVELQPLFVLTYYEKTDETRQLIYFEKNLSDFNRAALLSRRLKCVCQEPMLTQAQVRAHFASIDDYSRFIGLNGGNAISYFGRSLDYMLVQDYQSAIADLNDVLLRKDNFILAYFNRAVLRFRQLEVDEKAGMASVRNSDSDEELKNTALKAIGSQQAASVQGSGISIRLNTGTMTAQESARLESEHLARVRRLECELAVRDLEKVIELDPQFVYAYYNKAFIAAKLNDLDAAYDDFSRAIQLYPNFAEAYYNRGLILLRQGKTKAGIADLSKAGELGLAQAYSVLKRAQE